jgi:outer membrane protein TolC
MRRRLNIVLLLMLMFCVSRTALAQIEKQAQTYDMTLEDCLAWTLKGNPDIQQSRMDVERAAGTKLVFRSRALPQLNAQLNAGLREGNLYPPSGPFALATAQFSQPLFDMAIPPTLRRAKLEVILAQQALHQIVSDQLYTARVNFLQALYFRDLIALYEEIDKRLQANVQSEQQRIDAGTGHDEAVKTAKIQQLNLELQLTNLRGSYFSTVTALAQLCGRDTSGGTNGSQQMRLPNPVGVLHYEPAKTDMAQESAYALDHRADLKLLQALADATAADKQTIQAGYFPSVAVIASGLLIPQNLLVSKQTSIIPGQDPRTSEVRAGLALTWQVIDNGQITGVSRQLEALRQEYEITLHKLKQNIPRELATIEGELESADARHDALLKSAESAEENLRLIEAQVSLGEATQFDFLNAQSNLLSLRAGLVGTIQSHEAARAELDRATGRYLQYEEGSTP